MMVHPSFDTQTKTWFLEDGREAPTLRELRSKLRRSEKIENYFPLGSGHDLKIRESKRVPRQTTTPKPKYVQGYFNNALLPAKVEPRSEKPEVEVKREPKPRKPRHLWQQSNPVPWSEQNDNILREMAAQGYSAKQVAERIGVYSRNAVIGRAHRLGINLHSTSRRFRKRPVVSQDG